MLQASSGTVDEQILSFVKTKGQLFLKKVLLEFDQADQALVELRIMAMVRKGMLEMQRKGDDYLLVVGKKQNIDEKTAQKEARSLNTRLVASLPLSLHADSLITRMGASSTDKAFHELLTKATRYVKLSLPFPEESIIMHYSDQLRQLSLKKVRLQVLTREVYTLRSARDFRYFGLAKSFMRLWDIYRSTGNGHLFEARDFHRHLGDEDSSVLHYESTHAKIVSVDGLQCYIGSAEFRLNSLHNNFELGFLLDKSTTEQVETMFNIVWNNARPINYEILNKALNKEPWSRHQHKFDSNSEPRAKHNYRWRRNNF